MKQLANNQSTRQDIKKGNSRMILSNQLAHTEDGWRDAQCTPVLLGLLPGRLPRRLCPGRRARLQKLHCRPLVVTVVTVVTTFFTKNLKNSNYDEIQKVQIVMKLKNSNYDETLKLEW